MIMYFCLSPVFCFIVELISYLAFLGLFAFVILRKFCIRITFYEYLLVLWMLSIQIERIRKFVAIPNKRKRDKLKMIMQDRWNLMYLLSMLTFIVRIQKLSSLFQGIFWPNQFYGAYVGLKIRCEKRIHPLAGLILRGASLVSYEDIFNINVKAFKELG